MLKYDTRMSPMGPGRIIKGFVILLVILMIGSLGYMTIEK
jgi:hypothetical protein